MGDIVVTLPIPMTQCLAKNSLREEVVIWVCGWDTVHQGAEGLAAGTSPHSVRLLVHISVSWEEKGMLLLNWMSPF